jgi:predicted nucleotidyltransferase component of viral defense system
MVNPTRDTAAGRVYNDLRNLAHRNGRSTDEIMIEYVLERFLYRLTASPLGRDHFVLKGGLLLAQFGARRMTRDIDILGRAFPGDEAEIIRRIAGIAATEIDDGVVFDPATLKSVAIREEDEYHGLRLSMAASIARARLKLQLDVSFGDPVTPGPRTINYPQQLATESFQLLGYPIATVIAEKLSTAVSLGDLNTRDRDYADLYRLLTLNNLDGQELTAALAATAAHRGITLKPLSTAITDLAERRQTSYTAWRRRQGPSSASYPERFADVIRQVTTLADPLLTGDAATRIWHAATRTWREGSIRN